MEQTVKKEEYKTPFLFFILFFTLFYPMLISIYVFFPLFIGASSYLLIEGLEKKQSKYIVFSSVYLINLEVNLSLPLFLTMITSFIFYLTVYPSLRHFRRCKLCKAIISVIVLDISYLGALLGFDFIYQTNSIVLDMILPYSFVVDILIVVLL